MKTTNNIKLYAYLGFLVVLLVYVVYRLYAISGLPQLGWTASDWLINYGDGGFKRKGMSGSMLFFIQDHTGLPLSVQIFSIQTLFFVLIFYFTIRLLLSKILNWDIMLLLCSPLCLLFMPVDIFNAGRKEIILIALVLFLAFGKMTVWKEYLFLAAFIIGLFFHELLYFYLPFAVAVYLLKTRHVSFRFLGSLLLLSTAVMAVLFFLVEKSTRDSLYHG